VILNRIEEYLDYSLIEPALSQAKEIMNQYVALKKALFDFEVERSASLKEIMDQGGVQQGQRYLALLKEQLEAQRDLRALHLSPETHEAFYSDEEAYDAYSFARMEVSADKNLTEEEKQARYIEIDAQAPSEIVEARKEAQVTDILRSKTKALKESGASQQEIKALRTQMLGPEAAERFEVLDQERASWNQRIESYLQKRQEILSNEGLSLEAKQQQINVIRESEFDSREQIRLKVYEGRADAVK
jgi:lipase chaperone LimK